MSAHTDPIPKVQQLKKLEPAFTYHVLFNVNLEALSGPLQVREPSLTHQSQGNDAPGNPNLPAVSLQVCPRGSGKLGRQIRNSVGPAEFMRVRWKTQRLDLTQFFLTLLELIARLELQWKILSISAGEYSGPRLRRARTRQLQHRPPPALPVDTPTAAPALAGPAGKRAGVRSLFSMSSCRFFRSDIGVNSGESSALTTATKGRIDGISFY